MKSEIILIGDGHCKSCIDVIEQQRGKARLYQDLFNSLNIPFIHGSEHTRSNYWLNTIILYYRKTRDEFLKATNEVLAITRPSGDY